MDMNDERVVFTKEMKKEYTILVPTMLPVHFELILAYFRHFGYKMKLLQNDGQSVIDEGLKNVHNDTCYPALLVIGQMLDAIEHQGYDSHKIALLISQTGGGCRASNYISLLRKALKKSGYGYIPVISLNFSGLESNPGFKVTFPMVINLMYSILYGDLLMLLRNQIRPYELEKGSCDKLVNKWTEDLSLQMGPHHKHNYGMVKENYVKIINDFKKIKVKNEKKVKVGIVGEIFVKFSPLGNNHLEDLLYKENAEVKMPGLLGFCCYCIYNNILDYKLYGMNHKNYLLYSLVYKIILKKEKDLLDTIKNNSSFDYPLDFRSITALHQDYVHDGAKMGEGWLLTAEMIALIKEGVPNIICAQPFGCLPNHIVGKGMMNPLKKDFPDANIIAIDYDSSSSKINQENRIKLMLANARDNLR